LENKEGWIPQMGVGSFINKSLKYFSKPLQRTVKRKYLSYKYQVHAFDKSLDWKWQETNYNRIALVNVLVSKKQDPAYLEIGCQSNDLFDSVPCQQKTGVDPAAGGTVRETSDAFFEKNTQLFDVVFIDGLHTYEQVRRDVVNAIRFLKPGGFIALHDMLPGSWIEHHVPRICEEWTGDTWKVAFDLAQSKGIDFIIAKIDHGVGVLRLTEEKPALADLTGELRDKEFEYFYNNFGKLPLVEWPEFVRWVG
jgi:SAM-dependent methyltransferase